MFKVRKNRKVRTKKIWTKNPSKQKNKTEQTHKRKHFMQAQSGVPQDTNYWNTADSSTAYSASKSLIRNLPMQRETSGTRKPPFFIFGIVVMGVVLGTRQRLTQKCAAVVTLQRCYLVSGLNKHSSCCCCDIQFSKDTPLIQNVNYKSLFLKNCFNFHYVPFEYFPSTLRIILCISNALFPLLENVFHPKFMGVTLLWTVY